jgi:hypothetical protein
VTSRELTSVVLGLFGVWLVLHSVVWVEWLSHTVLSALLLPEHPVPHVLSLADYAPFLEVGLPIGILLFVVPGVLIVRHRDRLAGAWFRESKGTLDLNPNTLFSAGLQLLGAYFLVTGALEVVTPLGELVLASHEKSGMAWTAFFASLVWPVAGAILVRWGRSIASEMPAPGSH